VTETVITVLELLAVALGVAGLAVVTAVAVGGTMGLGVGLIVASVLTFAASVAAARVQDEKDRARSKALAERSGNR